MLQVSASDTFYKDELLGTASRPAGRTIEDWIRGHVAAAAARV